MFQNKIKCFSKETKTAKSVGKCFKKLISWHREAFAAQSCFYSGSSWEKKWLQAIETLQSLAQVLKFAKTDYAFSQNNVSSMSVNSPQKWWESIFCF